MKTTVTPFLMFEGKAEEAMTLYVSAIPDSKVVDIKRYGPEGPGAEGSVMIARFALAGLPVFLHRQPRQARFHLHPVQLSFRHLRQRGRARPDRRCAG